MASASMCVFVTHDQVISAIVRLCCTYYGSLILILNLNLTLTPTLTLHHRMRSAIGQLCIPLDCMVHIYMTLIIGTFVAVPV